MGNILSNKKSRPCLYFCDNIITEVNKEFIDFMEFTKEELLGKSITEIGDLLKINAQIQLEDIACKYSGYIFTKSLSPREVNISLFYHSETNEKVYTFVEKPNSRLEDKLIFMQQTFIDNISGVAIYSVPDLILLKANKKYLDFSDPFFDKEGGNLGKPIAEVISGFSGSQIEVVWKNVLETQKTSYIKEFKFDKFTREKAYFDCVRTPIFETGKMKYILSTITEVTESVIKHQRLQEQKEIIEQQKEQLEQQKAHLENQNAQLKTIIENISDGICIFDHKGEHLLSNRVSREMFYSSCEYTGKISDVYKPSKMYGTDGQEIDIENMPAHRVLRGEKFNDMRVTIKLPDKTLEIDMSGTPIYDSKGNFMLGIVCSKDMTYYLSHEKTITSQYQFLKRIIDTFNLPVVRLSCPDLKVVNINKKAFNIVKLWKPDIKSIKQIKGSCIKDLCQAINIEECSLRVKEVLKEKKTKYLNNKKHFINGEDIYWNIIFEPLLESNGEIQEILIVVIDVTAEVKSNLVMEKTLRAQGEFLANISHELKTPLNVISSAVQLFSMYCKSGSLDEKKSSIIKYIESIKQNTYRLSKLINNIVDSSKIESGFFELSLSNNNIVEVVEEIVSSVTHFTKSKGLDIIFDTNTEEKIIACDPEKIERIVLNLISNAIKFSEVGDEILVEVKDQNEFIEISVEDNGIGIEDKDIDMIFDRFKQVDKSLSRNVEGTGIGLNLVKSIVELQGGHIHVESRFGQGSKFVVVLPTQRVMQENLMFDNNIRDIKQSIQVEFSDVS